MTLSGDELRGWCTERHLLDISSWDRVLLSSNLLNSHIFLAFSQWHCCLPGSWKSLPSSQLPSKCSQQLSLIKALYVRPLSLLPPSQTWSSSSFAYTLGASWWTPPAHTQPPLLSTSPVGPNEWEGTVHIPLTDIDFQATIPTVSDCFSLCIAWPSQIHLPILSVSVFTHVVSLTWRNIHPYTSKSYPSSADISKPVVFHEVLPGFLFLSLSAYSLPPCWSPSWGNSPNILSLPLLCHSSWIVFIFCLLFPTL